MLKKRQHENWLANKIGFATAVNEPKVWAMAVKLVLARMMFKHLLWPCLQHSRDLLPRLADVDQVEALGRALVGIPAACATDMCVSLLCSYCYQLFWIGTHFPNLTQSLRIETTFFRNFEFGHIGLKFGVDTAENGPTFSLEWKSWTFKWPDSNFVSTAARVIRIFNTPRGACSGFSVFQFFVIAQVP